MKQTLDFTDITTREDFHAYVAEILKFPEHYGKNLDALYDCLTDISEETEILLVDPWRARPVDKYIRKAATVFADAAESNAKLRVCFELA